jgi:hypothetical protein
MRIDRFKTYFRDMLADAADSGIAAIEEYQGPGMEDRPNLRIRGTDGILIELVMVGTAKQGGDNHTTPEVITEKSQPGIRVT